MLKSPNQLLLFLSIFITHQAILPLIQLNTSVANTSVTNNISPSNLSPIIINLTQPQPILLPIVPQQQLPPIPNLLNNLIYTTNNQQDYFELLNTNTTNNISGIIVTIHSGTSYDQLFTRVQQKSLENTTVLVYSTTSNRVHNLTSILSNKLTNDTTVPYENVSDYQLIQQMAEQVKSISVECPNCVIFNWECSAGYSNQVFGQGKKYVIQLLDLAINKGYMVMFSDFSLKALIHQWDSDVLGLNPFIKLDETFKPIQLFFRPQTLISSPSSQLQTIGELSNTNSIQIGSVGGTIVYTINQSVPTNQTYKLEVLTIATSQSTGQQYKIGIDGKWGTAGHVLLSYQSGGHLLASMGHWIQLMKINTSQQKLFDVAQRRYGSLNAQELRNQYQNLTSPQKIVFLQNNAIGFIQNQSPGQNYAFN